MSKKTTSLSAALPANPGFDHLIDHLLTGPIMARIQKDGSAYYQMPNDICEPMSCGKNGLVSIPKPPDESIGTSATILFMDNGFSSGMSDSEILKSLQQCLGMLKDYTGHTRLRINLALANAEIREATDNRCTHMLLLSAPDGHEAANEVLAELIAQRHRERLIAHPLGDMRPYTLQNRAMRDLAENLTRLPGSKVLTSESFDDHGDLNIRFRRALGKTSVTIPHELRPHQSAHGGRRPFPKNFEYTSNETLVGWISPHMLARDGKLPPQLSPAQRQELEERVGESCRAIAQHFGIPIEHRIHYPDADAARHLEGKACAAVIIATAPQYKDRLCENVWDHLLSAWKERNGPKARGPKPDLDHSNSWQQRIQSSRPDPLELSLQPFLDHRIGYPQTHVLNHHRLEVTPPTIEGKHPPSWALDLTDATSLYPIPNHALVLWLDPDYKIPDGHKTYADDVDVLLATLRHEFQQDFDAYLHTPPHIGAPSALIIMAGGKQALSSLNDISDAFDRVIDQRRHTAEKPNHIR